MLNALVTSPVWLVLALVLLLPALEASTFLGLLVPGETMVLVGGAVAHSGRVALAAVIGLAAIGAVLGDQAGFWLGRRYGGRIVARMPAGTRRAERVNAAVELVQRRGALAVASARWVPSLRSVVPAVAGMGRMRRSTFTVTVLVGGPLWAAAVAVAGYLAGASFAALEDRLGTASLVALGLCVTAAVLWRLVSRRRRGGVPR